MHASTETQVEASALGRSHPRTVEPHLDIFGVGEHDDRTGIRRHRQLENSLLAGLDDHDAIDRIVAFARQQCHGRVAQLEAVAALLEPCHDPGQLDLDEMLAVVGIDGTTVRENLERIGYAGSTACGSTAAPKGVQAAR